MRRSPQGESDVPIDPNYMTPNLRWGLFLKDHPGAPAPKFRVGTNAEAEQAMGVPADFQRDECGEGVTVWCVAVICYPDGTEAAEGWKEIPTKESTKNGSKDFVRNAENWTKLCTMALGRALKRAGYPDSVADLRAFLLYEQRNVEIGMIRAGQMPVAAIEARSVDATARAAGVAEPDQDRPDAGAEDADADAARQTGPVGGDEFIEPYPPALLFVAEDLSPEARGKLVEWLTAKGYTPEICKTRPAALNQAVAHATQLLEEAAA